ncbi:hypothetical protein GKZ89_03235 [Bacillus mangrovi]|uniref:SAM-dependent methyltransferase n=1 Tax=Metabacillus mangrovi TaxID=1491830 RepID=A0A7X2V370_9BACI|nr:SAM-dependent methyltransferase [Metabacillus mangrovi]MTH52407.1 hypothetical protein [Metabacillus mangrovi]
MKHFIVQELRRNGGSIPFSAYMELSLYHPEHGYYMSDKPKIGRNGDFYTASSISDVYGTLMGRWFADLCESRQTEPLFCEAGGGTGAFLAAFLKEWEARSPQTFHSGKVYCIEKSPFHQEKLRPLGVTLLSDLSELPDGFPGVFFSNEWFDAMPVRLIKRVDGSLYEAWVGEKDGSLEFIYKKCGEAEKYYTWAGNAVQEGCTAEIPDGMLQTLSELNDKLGEATVVTADYGLFPEQLQERRSGTIRGFRQHQLIADPLAYPFEMDLTYDIPLEAYRKAAAEYGWVERFIGKQTPFFWENGLPTLLQDDSSPDPFSKAARRNRAVRSLLVHDGISSSFHFLIHKKRG